MHSCNQRKVNSPEEITSLPPPCLKVVLNKKFHPRKKVDI